MHDPQLLYAALLGVGLAASCGLNTFLPLLILAAAARFHWFGIHLQGSYAWLGSDVALAALAVAALIEIVGDKVPAVDHTLDALGTVARPAAGALAAAAAFSDVDPAYAALAGLIVGAPIAFGFHSAKAGTRAASSATTLGLANPLLSLIEDIVAVGLTLLSLFFPLLVPLALLLLAWAAYRAIKLVRARLPRKSVARS